MLRRICYLGPCNTLARTGWRHPLSGCLASLHIGSYTIVDSMHRSLRLPSIVLHPDLKHMPYVLFEGIIQSVKRYSSNFLSGCCIYTDYDLRLSARQSIARPSRLVLVPIASKVPNTGKQQQRDHNYDKSPDPPVQ